MARVISASEARVHFGELLRRVSEEGEVVTVERGGKPLAVVISVEKYKDFEQVQRERQPEPDWWELAMQSRELVRKRYEGRTPTDINQIFDEMRSERDEQLLAGLVSPEELRRWRETESNHG